jgi:hypothetical protein
VGGAPVEPLPVAPAQDRSLGPLTDGQVDGAGGAGTSGMTAGLLPFPTKGSVR